MKIAIVGDLQYIKGERIEEVADDINSIGADYVIILGDYGYLEGYGSYEIFSEVSEQLKGIKCKRIIPLIGNHDMQHESGESLFKCGTVAGNYEKAFGFRPQNTFLEFDDFRVFCIHVDSQRKDEFCFGYECFVNDENFSEIKEEMEKYPDKPVIMVTHAPRAGCGLLTVPETHVRAGNAYLNQDHGYEKWIEFSKKYRQVVMWFNGHYHMGHKHEKSMVVTDGLAYFVTGCPTSQSRDGQRHTRVLDVDGGQIKVYTYDHDLKRIYEQPDYVRDMSIRGELHEKKSNTFTAGCGRVVENGLKCGKNGRVYAHTDNNILWEIDIKNQISTGAIHCSKTCILDGFTIDKEYIWKICGERIFGHRYDDWHRFVRWEGYELCNYIERHIDELPCDLSETIKVGTRIACRIDDECVCTTFNDKNGDLFFELISNKSGGGSLRKI